MSIYKWPFLPCSAFSAGLRLRLAKRPAAAYGRMPHRTAIAGCGLDQGLDDALIITVKNGDAIIVQHLINRGANVNARDIWTNTALSWAVVRNDMTCATLLLEAGADVNVESFKGLSLLHLAVLNSNLKMVELLLDKGADVNAVDNYQSTVLMNAINLDDTALVQLLLESGADVDKKNNQGQSASSYAQKFGHIDIIRKFTLMRVR